MKKYQHKAQRSDPKGRISCSDWFGSRWNPSNWPTEMISLMAIGISVASLSLRTFSSIRDLHIAEQEVIELREQLQSTQESLQIELHKSQSQKEHDRQQSSYLNQKSSSSREPSKDLS